MTFEEFRIQQKVPDPTPIILLMLETMPFNRSKRRINQLLSLLRNIPLNFLFIESKVEVIY